ncbi:MAG: efflux RND transporter periplasmic adaptor subunit [Hyphomicrobium sp.]
MLRRVMAWFVVLAAMAGVAAGLSFYKINEFKNAKAAAEASPEPMESIATVRARKGHWVASERAIGTVVATRQIELRNEIAGTIAKLGFASGQVVEAGVLLIAFDTRQEEASLASAQAETRLAKLTLERRESLRGSAAFSAQEFDKAREELAGAEARAQSLQVAIDKKRIHSPFRARIGITDLQPGSYLDVGTLVTRLQGVDTDAYIDFSLPQDSTAMIHNGTTVSFTTPALDGKTHSATIIAEDDSIDSNNRTVRFRASAAGLGDVLRPGAFVDVTAVISEPRDTVLVPLSAVRRSPNGQHVFLVVEEGGKLRARQRPVETGAVQDNEIGVEKGVAEGELVATSGSFKLRDGVLVQTETPKVDGAPVGLN